jgi:hypothetical protein
MSAPGEKNKPSAKPGTAETEKNRRPYSPPRILSAELLEIAAAKCDVGGFGKEQSMTPPTCLDGVGS